MPQVTVSLIPYLPVITVASSRNSTQRSMMFTLRSTNIRFVHDTVLVTLVCCHKHRVAQPRIRGSWLACNSLEAWIPGDVTRSWAATSLTPDCLPWQLQVCSRLVSQGLPQAWREVMIITLTCRSESCHARRLHSSTSILLTQWKRGDAWRVGRLGYVIQPPGTIAPTRNPHGPAKHGLALLQRRQLRPPSQGQSRIATRDTPYPHADEQMAAQTPGPSIPTRHQLHLR